jgi:hypothetical protein
MRTLIRKSIPFICVLVASLLNGGAFAQIVVPGTPRGRSPQPTRPPPNIIAPHSERFNVTSPRNPPDHITVPGTPVGPGQQSPLAASATFGPMLEMPAVPKRGIVVPGWPVGPMTPTPDPGPIFWVPLEAPPTEVNPATPEAGDKPDTSPFESGLFTQTPRVSPLAATATLPLTQMPLASVQAKTAFDVQPAAAGATNFMDVDSGLRDCEIPFDQLREKSPACRSTALNGGRRCEQYSPTQFPEVVAIVSKTESGQQICTGVLISDSWVITAAHCIIGNDPTSKHSGDGETDLMVIPGSADAYVVSAPNTYTLSPADRNRSAVRAVVYRKYGGIGSVPPFKDDLALLELSASFPKYAVLPAILAPPQSFSQMSTLAGFGYSNADGGTIGQFNLTWPLPLKRANGQLTFTPGDGAGDNKSAFCQGDSGGPVFAGRYRGCKQHDAAPEPRPRVLQGLISFDRPGPSNSRGNDAMRSSQSCMNASEMSMQDVTLNDRRHWICAATGNAANGC